MRLMVTFSARVRWRSHETPPFRSAWDTGLFCPLSGSSGAPCPRPGAVLRDSDIFCCFTHHCLNCVCPASPSHTGRAQRRAGPRSGVPSPGRFCGPGGSAAHAFTEDPESLRAAPRIPSGGRANRGVFAYGPGCRRPTSVLGRQVTSVLPLGWRQGGGEGGRGRPRPSPALAGKVLRDPRPVLFIQQRIGGQGLGALV